MSHKLTFEGKMEAMKVCTDLLLKYEVLQKYNDLCSTNPLDASNLLFEIVQQADMDEELNEEKKALISLFLNYKFPENVEAL